MGKLRSGGRRQGRHLLWTRREDNVLLNFYPDYAAIRRRIRKRTFKAIKRRVDRLGISKRRHTWTGKEIQLLRRIYLASSAAGLQKAFPELRLQQIESRARALGLQRKRPELKITGLPLIDAIRKRALNNGISMVRLDAMARSKTFFQNHRWQGYEKHPAILRAIYALGGEISVVWDAD